MKENILNSISDKKQKAIDKKNVSVIRVGEHIVIPECVISNYVHKEGNQVTAIVIKVYSKKLIVKQHDYPRAKEKTILKSDIISRDIRRCGANPFDEKFDSIRPVAFTLSSVIHGLDLSKDRREKPYIIGGVTMKELNWNPYVYNKLGQKEYYQRDFCWSLQDKQLLIESIYSGIDCGKILVRLHGWKDLEKKAANGEKELAFKDIVDGKQRMKTIQEFIFDKFPDMHGNYYSDLSHYSHYKFSEHQLFSYAEMPEDTNDEEDDTEE